MRCLIFGLVTAFALTLPAAGQCPATEVATITLPGGATGWFPSVHKPWQWYYQNGRLAEAWNPATKDRLLFTKDKTWAQITAAMVESDQKLRLANGVMKPPVVGVKEEPFGPPEPQRERNEGLDREELSKDRPAYTVTRDGVTRSVGKGEIIDLLTSPESDKVPDDRGKPWLVAVGPGDFLKQVATDLEAAPILKTKVRYQGYAPDSWPAQRKFGLQDNPKYQQTKQALFLAYADGTVAHAQYDYKAGDLVALGQRFDPSRVPDLRLPERVGEGAVDQLFKKIKEEPIIWAGFGLVVFLLLRRPNP